MVLNSQRARPESGRGSMASSGRRSRMKMPLVIIVLAVVAAASWYMIRESGGTGKQDTNAQQTQPASNGAPNTPAAPPLPVTAGLGGNTSTPAPANPTPPAAPKPPEPVPPVAPAQSPDTGTTDVSDITAPKAADTISQGRQQIQQNNMVAGRQLLNMALAGQISRRDAELVRKEIAAVNDTLIFSPQVVKDDPYAAVHVVQSGELLAKIAPQYHVPWQFLTRINNIKDPKLLRVGARLKVIKGPFHVVVHKESFRADVYLEAIRVPSAAGTATDMPMFVRSFPVALGSYDSTPIGTFIVKRHSKLINPEWVNPRTGQRFVANDPNNPLGEYWIGLDGTDANTRQLQGYGLHGTIDPSSIGRQASMGCVRFLPADIELLYSMLTETESRVTIREP